MRAIATAAILGILAGCGGAPEKKETPAPAPAPKDPHAAMGEEKPARRAPYFGAMPNYEHMDRMQVASVAPGSPAEKAGLKSGDVIESYNGDPIEDLQDYSDRLFAQKAGDTITLRIASGGAKRDVRVTLAAKPGTEE